MIMLSGVMYLGFKVNEKHALNAATKANQKKINASNLHDAVSIPEHVLEVLHAQHLVGQLIYKTKILLPDATFQSTAPNRDALWQQGQQQLTFVQATVHVAVDLSELTTQSLSEKKPASILLPPARIAAVQIDSVTSYDIKTGLPSTVQLGLSMTNAQSQDIEAQIEHDVCTTGIFQIATEDSRQRVVAILDSIHVPMIVQVTDPVICRKSTS